LSPLPPILLLFIGFTALIAGAELLVRSASKIALLIGLSPLLIGLTIVTIGTSAPELAVAAAGALENQTDVSLGNVIGSNIFNVFFILGLLATISPIHITRKIIRIDVPIFIAASVLLLVLSLDGKIGVFDGIIFLLAVVAFIAFEFYISKSEGNNMSVENKPAVADKPADKAKTVTIHAIVVAMSIGILAIGSHWVVSGATTIARQLGISEFIIGVTIIAFGTSLPELATSLVALRRGQRDIAVGNIIGSGIFNIIGILPVMALLSGNGVLVPHEVLAFDIPVAITAAIVCLPIFFTGYRISRWEGVLLLGYYIAYTLFLYLEHIRHDALPTLNWIMVVFVAPITILTLGIVSWRAMKKNN